MQVADPWSEAVKTVVRSLSRGYSGPLLGVTPPFKGALCQRRAGPRYSQSKMTLGHELVAGALEGTGNRGRTSFYFEAFAACA